MEEERELAMVGTGVGYPNPGVRSRGSGRVGHGEECSLSECAEKLPW